MGFIKARKAKEGRAGNVQLATVQETVAGTDTTKAVTPQGVKASVAANIPYATSTRIGGIKLEFDATTGTLNIITEEL